MRIKFVKKGGIPIEIFNKMFVTTEKKEEEKKEGSGEKNHETT
ncbi:MAG: hypothetical protein PHC68_18930 [Syntrophorhabdaceae bacterium]|nr:hypothetical protein [Syntrophorhabdaceae bacterium]